MLRELFKFPVYFLISSVKAVPISPRSASFAGFRRLNPPKLGAGGREIQEERQIKLVYTALQRRELAVLPNLRGLNAGLGNDWGRGSGRRGFVQPSAELQFVEFDADLVLVLAEEAGID